MLINYPSVFLNTYDPNYPQKIVTYDNDSHLVKRDYDYIFIQFSFDNSFEIFPLDQVLTEDQIKNIQNFNHKLVLDNQDECLYNVVDSIYKNIVIKYNIPPEQIILMSGAPCIIDYIREVSGSLSLSCINAEWVCSAPDYVKGQYHQFYKNSQPQTLVDKDYPKKFLSFNRRWRPWRPMLVSLLSERGFLDQGYVSLGESDISETWDSVRDNLEVKFKFPRIKTSLPAMYLDTNDLITNRVGLSTSTDRFFEDSYFSVITETTYFNNESVFLTEKTFKSIVMQHPFILVTVPGSLKFLKQLGYKTFDGLINESYDQEQDDTLRLSMIIDEIQRLSNLNKEQLSTFLKEAKLICTYNFNHLMTSNNYVIEQK
jgi:hypothetical protein